jgi:hypothetical protein
LLQVPVRYYRHPPAYFRGWAVNAAPRWQQHWGNTWAQRRAGWDHVNRASAPAAAPLPHYQRSYTGNRYPSQPQQQAAIQDRSYRYQPRDEATRQHWQQQRSAQTAQAAPQQQQRAAQQQQRAAQPQQPAQQQQAHEQRQQERAVERGQRVPDYRNDHGEHSGG